MSSRLENSARNIKWGVIGQFLTIFFNFASRTVFLYCFTKEYVGVGSLFLGIFSVLSLADLGMETSMTVHLYKPLAHNDISKIKAYLLFYKKAYYYIALIITLLGLSLLPFLHYIVDIPDNVNQVEWIYILTLANTTVSYLFIYRKILLVADQKKYITDIIQYVRMLSQFVVLIPILIIFKDYLLYLFVQIIFTILYNIIVMYKAKKVYPFIDELSEELDSKSRQIIKRDMIALSLHRVGDVVNQNAVTLLTGSFVNVIAVAVFSNYQILITHVKTLLDKVYYSVSPSVGNLTAESAVERAHDVLMKFVFASFWITTFTATALLCLLNPFIQLWIGESYLFNEHVVFLIVVSFILVNMRKPALIFKEAYGLFANDQWRPLVESFINVGISIVSVKVMGMGLSGILLGGIVSSLLTSWWIEPYILFSKGFRIKCAGYFKHYLLYVFVMFVIMFICKMLCTNISSDIIGFVFKILVVIVVPNFLIFMVYRNNKYYVWIINIIINRIKPLMKKKSK